MHNSDPWHYYVHARFCPKQTHYFDNTIYPYVNIQDLAKCLLTSVPQIIPVVSNSPLLPFHILMVMEYGVLEHLRQSIFESEDML